MSRVWAGSRHKGGALLLMLALADFAHDDGTNAYPSIATLARKTRMSDRQVQRIIQQCEKSGELVAYRSADGRSSTTYTVVLDALPVTGAKMSPVVNRARRGDTGVTRTVKEPSEDSSTGIEAERLWNDVKAELRALMNATNYRTWVEDTEATSIHAGVLTVRASRHQREALMGRFKPLLERALGGQAVRFETG